MHTKLIKTFKTQTTPDATHNCSRCNEQQNSHKKYMSMSGQVSSHDRRVISASRNLLLSSVFSSITAEGKTEGGIHKYTMKQC